jgi:cyanophycin synthetase
MRIQDIKVLQGPNYWSAYYKQLIALTIDEGNFRNTSTSDIPRFAEDLRSILPTLFDPKKDFAEKIGKGMRPVAVIPEIATELQHIAGMSHEPLSMETVTDKEGTHIVFPYLVEEAGVFAGEKAVRIVETLCEGEKYKDISYDIDDLIHLKYRYSIGPTTGYLLDEVKKREIPFRQFNSGSLITLGHGVKQKKIRTAITDKTSGLGMEIASDKEETKVLLDDAYVPVPKGILVSSEDELRERINEVRFPIVIKPLNGNHGRGITTDISNIEDAIFGFNLAKKISNSIIVEEFVKGDDYRFLVVDYKLVAATKRTPAQVTGDGISTIQELIDKENSDPDRGEGPEYVLTLIRVDAVTEKILNSKKLTLDSVLPKGEVLSLKDTANISSGGVATDVTDSVHPENKFMAERIARLFNLDICGIDLMAQAVDVPITRDIGAIIEVNAGPGLRMHSNPQRGTPRDVSGKIMEMLFPTLEDATIPLIAVSNYEGADITTRLIAQLATQSGYKAGCNTSKGIFIQDHVLSRERSIKFGHVQEVLFDPTIDFAVVQCGDSSVFNVGLGFNKCDMAIITENENLHIKGVLLNSIRESGYAILNADVEEVYALHHKAGCQIALFSADIDNEKIKQHIAKGGLAAILNNGEIIINKGENVVAISELKGIWDDTDLDDDMIAKCILPAVLVATIKEFHVNAIVAGLLAYSSTQLIGTNSER